MLRLRRSVCVISEAFGMSLRCSLNGLNKMLAQAGDRVRVRYTHMQDAGAAPVEELPKPQMLEFTVGGSHALPGLSQCVAGMHQGEQKCVTLQPAEAFGIVHNQLIEEISRGSIRSKSPLKVGMQVSVRRAGATDSRKARIVELKSDSVVVDGNHPHAGRSVHLAMYLVSVDPSFEANQSKPQMDRGGES
jgi:FKBP-type peptidyl-prolyl cis-trans isomerase 2